MPLVYSCLGIHLCQSIVVRVSYSLGARLTFNQAEAEVKVKVVVVADVAMAMLTVMPYTHQIKRRSDGHSEC